MSLSEPRKLHLGLFDQTDILLVVRPAAAPPIPFPGQPGVPSDYVQPTPEVFIAVLARQLPEQGAICKVLAFNGHVDLGTGIQTALTQIVAEELDVPMNWVEMVLGHTSATPNQGPTIASNSIQLSAIPLRKAAAQARSRLMALASEHLGVPESALGVEAGKVRLRASAETVWVDYGSLLLGRHEVLHLSEDVQLKPSSAYRLVGQSSQRVDIPAKAVGDLRFVHDVRVPGMRHGRVIRPPYPGRDAGNFVGQSLIRVNVESVAHLPGNVDVVVRGDFVGVVADREEQAVSAMRALEVMWKPIPPAPDLSDLAQALRRQPAQERVLIEQGDVPGALSSAPVVLRNSYVWPYQLHASIGPSCAVASFGPEGLTVWSGTQNPHMLRADLNRLFSIGEDCIDIVRLEASGCYGRNCADDVCADAALLSQAVGAPVRVQLTREQEHQWEPKGTAQLMEVTAALDEQGALLAYDFEVSYPSNDAPLLAQLLTGAIAAEPRTLQMGDRTAVPPYRYPHLHVISRDMPPLVRASWLRGVSALPNSFAHDSMVDELAATVGADPLAFRLRHLDDGRARDVLAATARKAGWDTGATGSRGQADDGGWLHGRGLSYARYVHSRFPGAGGAWAAWVVDLSVHARTGRIVCKRIVVGQDTGLVVNPAGVRHQIQGNIIQILSRTLYEKVSFDASGVTSREWGSYPIIGFQEIPQIEVLLIPRPDDPPMGAGESASVSGPAAIANALFDATGVRFRQAPFTPDRVRAALQR